MRHPFDGILGQPAAGEFSPAPRDTSSTRRSFFGKIFALAAGAAAFFSGRAYAQDVEGSNWGAVDPGRNGFGPADGQMTTQALGEEGAGFPSPPDDMPSDEGQVTTFALGEEGAGFPSPPDNLPPADGPVTTYALGEEGNLAPPDFATTYAFGEEAGFYPYPPRRRGYYFRRPRNAPLPWYGSRPPYRRYWY